MEAPSISYWTFCGCDSVIAKRRLNGLCSSTWRVVHSLLRRFAVEVLVIDLRLVASMVDDAIPMIRRRIERVQLHGYSPGIDDVVICSSRDEYREARPDCRPNAIENGFTGTLLHAKELVELVDFRPDVFLGFSAMTTSWEFFAVYTTRRNSSFLMERPSMSCTNPFIATPFSFWPAAALGSISVISGLSL